MKKLFVLFVSMCLILIGAILSGCATTSNSSNDISFEDAVQEIYKVVGEKYFYYSWFGSIPSYYKGNNEKPGCYADYAIEFVHQWNKVYKYDKKFGKAFLVRWDNQKREVSMSDVSRPGNLSICEHSNVTITNKKNIKRYDPSHYGIEVENMSGWGRDHMWNVIKIGDKYWGVDAQNADFSSDGGFNFPPYEANIR